MSVNSTQEVLNNFSSCMCKKVEESIDHLDVASDLWAWTGEGMDRASCGVFGRREIERNSRTFVDVYNF